MRCFVFFFFSSRRRHTRLQGDWSSDVCSSDLHGHRRRHGGRRALHPRHPAAGRCRDDVPAGLHCGEHGLTKPCLPPSKAPPCGAFCLPVRQDRKSTRLNSSHLVISYAVFCLKKKKKKSLVHSTPP